MAHGLEFATGSSLGNDSVYGAPTEWVWSRDGVGIAAVYDSKGYPKRPDMFFAVGWQVTIPTDPSSTGLPDSGRLVRLWVDSPR